ncbi:anti-virulence regulator CigR family protein [Pseudomonas typographi]|uniref:RcnB family protein n=1 Tax=Pseudomonas typographi TaxID=2715964 RepID=A0ABR7Z442_9PSED|nr:anti-virulence regulator CigR family protein [Pseudomonas typographi]MBD1588288.1 RcnB family protein [Pseudomonas typographi]MBD1600259.1 RcnB family protein [Pseudomonas typographi]
MKSARSVIAGLSLMLAAAAPLVQAGPGSDDHGQQHSQGQGGQGGRDGQSAQRGPGGPGGQGGQGHQDNREAAARGQNGLGQRPPADFDQVRNTISEHRADFGRGQQLPPNVRIAKGEPLPRGYGRPLDARARARLPHYEGYEWRRLGTDVALVAVGTGIVYELLSGVLN